MKKMFNGRVHTTNVFTFLCFCVLLCSFEANAQTQIAFIYDVAGNQIERKIICVNCTTSAKVEEKLSNIFLKDSTVAANKFQAYPNPLIETLHVSWKTVDQSYIKTIDVYSANGTLVYHKTCHKDQNQISISFFNLTTGMYLLKATYSNQKQEILKIMKQ